VGVIGDDRCLEHSDHVTEGEDWPRRSFIHLDLSYRKSIDIPSRIEVGGSVMPMLKGEPRRTYALAVAASLTG
jgi:hypothetical protein